MDQDKVLEILKKGWFSTAYNPKIDCHHITFDIYDEEEFKQVDEWLHPLRYQENSQEIYETIIEGKRNVKS